MKSMSIESERSSIYHEDNTILVFKICLEALSDKIEDIFSRVQIPLDLHVELEVLSDKIRLEAYFFAYQYLYM